MAYSAGGVDEFLFTTATVASGATLSAEINCTRQGIGPVNVLVFPSTFEGTTITLTAAFRSAGTFRTIYSGGSNYSVTVAASKRVVLDPAIMAFHPFVKISCASTQSGARGIVAEGRNIYPRGK